MAIRAPALLALVALWTWKVYSTWGAWGNLTIDSGRELYVPALLAQGKMLYRDVWYIYGPVAPYFNSVLFRVFGSRLEVLYWAGSLSVLISAVFLYLLGIQLQLDSIGWATAAVVVFQSFQPSLFCFPLAYSFGSVYGAVVACVFLWIISHVACSGGHRWIFAAGCAASVGLLLKLEFGMACYGALGALVIARVCTKRSWRQLRTDLLAILPGGVVCTAVIGWMISIAGIQFITQENSQSWPGSYFMRTYGHLWLEHTGFTLEPQAIVQAFLRISPLVGLWVVLDSRLWKYVRFHTQWLRAALGLFVAVHLAATVIEPSDDRTERMLSTIFFPRDMVFLIAIAAAASWWLWKRGLDSMDGPRLAIPVLLTFSSLLAFRMLMLMTPSGYPIYYNGPAVFSFLYIACFLATRSRLSRGAVLFGRLAICMGCLTVAFLSARRLEAVSASYVPFHTSHGTIHVKPALAANYQAAIDFIRAKAAKGEVVLSLPEDTSLYFLSDTTSPTRIFVLTPGGVPPGRMTARTIREIEDNRVRYLLWSNRTFTEYGAPIFGWDFNRDLGDYLRSRFEKIGPLSPIDSIWNWTVNVWQLKPQFRNQ
jgi:hypothetical protein